MADFLNSGAATRMAGSGMSSTMTENAWCDWISGAQAIVNATARVDYTSSAAKPLLQETGHAIMAINAVRHDMSGYSSRGEAEDVINVLNDRVNKNLVLIKEQKVKDFI